MVAAIKSRSDQFHTADFGHAETMTQGDDDTLRGEIGPGRVAEDDIGALSDDLVKKYLTV